jgi:Flp pilus assembly protein TadG
LWFAGRIGGIAGGAARSRAGRGATCSLLPRISSRVRSVARCRRGAETLAFALTVIPLLLVLLCAMEVGWQVATGVAVDNAVLHAARFGALGRNTVPDAADSPSCQSASIPFVAVRAGGGLLRADRLTVAPKSYSGTYSTYNAPNSGTAGPGQSASIVVYTLTYRQPHIFKGIVALGSSAFQWTVFTANEQIRTAAFTIRNEPFPNATNDPLC